MLMSKQDSCAMKSRKVQKGKYTQVKKSPKTWSGQFCDRYLYISTSPQATRWSFGLRLCAGTNANEGWFAMLCSGTNTRPSLHLHPHAKKKQKKTRHLYCLWGLTNNSAFYLTGNAINCRVGEENPNLPIRNSKGKKYRKERISSCLWICLPTILDKLKTSIFKLGLYIKQINILKDWFKEFPKNRIREYVLGASVFSPGLNRFLSCSVSFLPKHRTFFSMGFLWKAFQIFRTTSSWGPDISRNSIADFVTKDSWVTLSDGI